MSKATPDLSVLIAAKNGLVYLTANDWALIADKALRKQFKQEKASCSASAEPTVFS